MVFLIKNVFVFVFLSLAICSGTFVTKADAAQSIDPAIIARIQSLPPERQKALARQYGVDPRLINSPGELAEPNYRLGQPGEKVKQLPSRAQLERLERLETETKTILDVEDGFWEQDEKEEQEELKRFGIDIFDEEVTSLTSVDDMAIPNSYVLGVGDELLLTLIGTEQGERTSQVKRNGTILIPRIGEISVAGMTFAQAKEFVEGLVSEQLIGTKVFVSMGRLKNVTIFLAG